MMLYRWRYPIRTDVLDYCPGRVMDVVRFSAIRDAADDGYRPGSLPHITTLDAPGAWTTVQVEFDAVPLDVEDPGECVDCGQRPAWGPGARRCRPCFAMRDRQQVLDADDGGVACGDLAGTQAGYRRHLKADEKACRPCLDAAAESRRRHRERTS